jgi:hypothetical protein
MTLCNSTLDHISEYFPVVPAGHLPANYKNTGGLYHLARPRFPANFAAILAKFVFLYLYAYAKYALNK